MQQGWPGALVWFADLGQHLSFLFFFFLHLLPLRGDVEMVFSRENVALPTLQAGWLRLGWPVGRVLAGFTTEISPMLGYCSRHLYPRPWVLFRRDLSCPGAFNGRQRHHSVFISIFSFLLKKKKKTAFPSPGVQGGWL
ncbi:uncharacterized protein LY79DRAFT_36674 [Colletotrichum navitas]|uniref:Uncharacterized protein n=1 Tax=Colletotrichum navitas TaxID=681940 RepID=A0AAD8V7A9_9PEZI|nr:uncharacterized protein LY79DRAFT_36674 [Colletotrichum navitas]KAK1596957.1 hypothetical protein LY79DRAFT_36674 [Colletotrichum navitas]